MITKIYLRLGKTKKGRFHVLAGMKPLNTPISHKEGYNDSKPIPTICFGISVKLPDDAFKEAEKIIAELEISNRQIEQVEVLNKTK